MIPTSTPYATANASLNKEPTWLLKIQGYSRIFTNRSGLGKAPSLSINPIIQYAACIVDVGGFTTFPSSCTLTKATPAGNIIFAFLRSNGVIPIVVTDTAGNTYTQIYQFGATGGGTGAPFFTVFVATALAAAAGNVVTWEDGGGHGDAEFYVVEVSSAYSGFTYAGGTPVSAISSPFAISITVSGVIFTIPTGAGGITYPVFVAQLAPASGPNVAVTIGFVAGGIPNYWLKLGNQTAVFSPSIAASYDWLVSIDDLKETVSDLDGSSDLADLVFNVQDQSQQITADLASFVFEGKECRLLEGFVGMNLGDYLTRFRGVVNTVDSDNSNTEYKFTVSNFNLKKLSAKIYTLGDDGFTTDSNHPRSINGHPMDILVSALQQTGIVLSDIDTAKIDYYRDFIFNGLQYVFTLTSAPTAKDFIENELMKPMGMYLRENNLGLISIISFYPAIAPFGGYTPVTPPVLTLDLDNTTLVPIAQEAQLINQVIGKFDDDGTGSQKFEAEQITDYDLSVSKYGLTDGHTVESQGLKSSFQGYLMAELLAFLIFLRYGLKNLVLDPVPCLWSASLLEPGDIVALSEPFVPDRKAGVLGITLQTFEVLDRTWKFQEGIAELKLLAIDLSKFKQYEITPNGEADFAADTAPNQAKYMYLCGSNGLYSTGAPANTLG